MASSTISRRSFIVGAATAGAAASLATIQVARADEAEQQANTEFATATKPAFMTPPEPVAEDQIVQTIDCDVLVIAQASLASQPPAPPPRLVPRWSSWRKVRRTACALPSTAPSTLRFTRS